MLNLKGYSDFCAIIPIYELVMKTLMALLSFEFFPVDIEGSYTYTSHSDRRNEVQFYSLTDKSLTHLC